MSNLSFVGLPAEDWRDEIFMEEEYECEKYLRRFDDEI